MLKRSWVCYTWATSTIRPPLLVASLSRSVALAASYHATRAGTPLHPVHRIFEAETAACYVPIRESAWRGQRLVPVAPAWDPGGESFGNAFRQLTDQGLPVEAWIVLAHNSALGREHGDLVVRNAFGDRYRTRCARLR